MENTRKLLLIMLAVVVLITVEVMTKKLQGTKGLRFKPSSNSDVIDEIRRKSSN